MFSSEGVTFLALSSPSAFGSLHFYLFAVHLRHIYFLEKLQSKNLKFEVGAFNLQFPNILMCQQCAPYRCVVF